MNFRVQFCLAQTLCSCQLGSAVKSWITPSVTTFFCSWSLPLGSWLFRSTYQTQVVPSIPQSHWKRSKLTKKAPGSLRQHLMHFLAFHWEGRGLWCSTMDPLVLSNASSNWLQGFLNNLLQLLMFLPKHLSPQAWASDASVRWPDLLIHSVMADSETPWTSPPGSSVHGIS